MRVELVFLGFVVFGLFLLAVAPVTVSQSDVWVNNTGDVFFVGEGSFGLMRVEFMSDDPLYPVKLEGNKLVYDSALLDEGDLLAIQGGLSQEDRDGLLNFKSVKYMLDGEEFSYAYDESFELELKRGVYRFGFGTTQIIVTDLSVGVFGGTFYNATNGSVFLNSSFTVGNYSSEVLFLSNDSVQVINVSWVNVSPSGSNVSVEVRTSNMTPVPYMWFGFDGDGNRSSLVSDYTTRHDLTSQNGASFTSEGYFEQGLSLGQQTANKDYALASNTVGLHIRNMTFCSWVNKNNNEDGYLFDINGVDMRAEDTGAEFNFNGDGTDCSIFDFQTTPIPNGSWVHICGVKNQSECAIYINGSRDAFEASDGGFTSTEEFHLGIRRSGLFQPLNASLDEVLFFNESLSNQEIINIWKGTYNLSNWTERSVSNPYVADPNRVNGTFAQARFVFRSDDSSLVPKLFNFSVGYGDFVDVGEVVGGGVEAIVTIVVKPVSRFFVRAGGVVK